MTSILTWTYSQNLLAAAAEALKDIMEDTMEHLSNDHKDNPNEHENSHKLWDEMGHPVLALL